MSTQPDRKHASFSILFRTLLLPRLEEFEHGRKRRRRLALALCLLILAVPAALAPYAWRDPYFHNGAIIPLLLLLAFPTFFVLRIFFPRTGQGWVMAGNNFAALEKAIFGAGRERRRFSQEIVAPIVGYVQPGLRHLPAEYIGQGDFLDSLLFGYNVGPYAGRDRFIGRAGRAGLDFSWLRADSVYTNNKGEKSYSPLFAGWFFAVRFGKEFRGKVILQPDRAEAALGWFGRSLQEIAVPPDTVLLHLEDPEFEHYFRVYASDQLESRYLLSPAFMRLAATFRKRLGADLSISFSRDCMYAALPGPVDYFHRAATRPFTDPAFSRHLCQGVKGVAELAESVGRNYVMWE